MKQGLILLLLVGSIAVMAVFGWLTITTFQEFLASETTLHAVIYGIGLVILIVLDFFIFFLGILASIAAILAE